MPYVEQKDREYYPEIDPDDWCLRYKYRTFWKGRDRHVFDREPRKIAYVMGNKFILDGDPPNCNYLYDARQLLPVENYEKDVRGIEEKRAAKYGKYIDGSRYMSNKGVPEGPKPLRFLKPKRKYYMGNF